jgi:hypothetical protein
MLQFTQAQHDRQAKARMLSGLIKVNWIRAYGMLGLFEDWAANTGRPGEVPEGRLDGPRAPQMLAALLEHRGDAEGLAAAFCELGILERTETGLRATGLEERYGPMFEAAATRSENASNAAKKRWADERRAKEEQAQCAPDAPADDPHAAGTADAMPVDAKGNPKEIEDPLSKEGGQLELEPSEASGGGDHPLQALWNRLAHPELPRWVGLSKTRKRIADARLRERSLQEYARIIERINASKFCRGVNDRNWKVTPDWFLKPDNIDKVLGGNYDGGEPPSPAAAEEPLPTLPATPAGSLWGRVLAKLRDDGHDYPLQWLRKLAPVAIQGGALVLEVEDVFLAEWVGATYGELLNAAVVELGGASRVTCRPPQAPEVAA